MAVGRNDGMPVCGRTCRRRLAATSFLGLVAVYAVGCGQPVLRSVPVPGHEGLGARSGSAGNREVAIGEVSRLIRGADPRSGQPGPVILANAPILGDTDPADRLNAGVDAPLASVDSRGRLITWNGWKVPAGHEIGAPSSSLAATKPDEANLSVPKAVDARVLSASAAPIPTRPSTMAPAPAVQDDEEPLPPLPPELPLARGIDSLVEACRETKIPPPAAAPKPQMLEIPQTPADLSAAKENEYSLGNGESLMVITVPTTKSGVRKAPEPETLPPLPVANSALAEPAKPSPEPSQVPALVPTSLDKNPLEQACRDAKIPPPSVTPH